MSVSHAGIVLTSFFVVSCITGSGFAEPALQSVGVREATSIKDNDSVRTHTLALRFNKGRWLKRIAIIDALEIDLGHMDRGTRSAAFLSLGPVFDFTLAETKQGRWFLEVGSHVAYFGDSLFEEASADGNFQFKSHLGLGRSFGNNDQLSLVLDYRHISNAGLQDASLGADMVSVSINFRFNEDL